MVLCLSSNDKECVAGQEGWLLIKIHYILGSKVVTFTLFVSMMGATNPFGHFLPYKLCRFHCFQSVFIVVASSTALSDFENNTDWVTENVFLIYKQ